MNEGLDLDANAMLEEGRGVILLFRFRSFRVYVKSDTLLSVSAKLAALAF